MRALRDLKKVPKALQPFIPDAIKVCTSWYSMVLLLTSGQQTGLATILVKIMHSRQFEHHPLLAERFATHRWGPQVAKELMKYTPSFVFVDNLLPLNVSSKFWQLLAVLVHYNLRLRNSMRTNF
jgi:hypothetical protein